MNNVDFVIPLKAVGIITKAVLQGIDRLYSPRRILIITDLCESNKKADYETKTPLKFIDENFFFGEKISKEALKTLFDKHLQENPGPHEPFGWWYQQLLKLGCHQVINDLSEIYVVWDVDLIPIKRWDLVVNGNKACTAILQNEPWSFVNTDYASATKQLIGVSSLRPSNNGLDTFPKHSSGTKYGTFVSHHMVMRKQYAQELLDLIQSRKNNNSENVMSWQFSIIDIARTHFRVSEYELYQTYCFTEGKEDNLYHPYEKYGGEGCARFCNGVNKDGVNIVDELKKFIDLNKIGYDDICEFVSSQVAEGLLFEKSPSYLQIDHIF